MGAQVAVLFVFSYCSDPSFSRAPAVMRRIFRAESPDSESAPSPDASMVSPGMMLDDDDEVMLAQMERMKQAAYQACLAEVEAHLSAFLLRRPYGSYEQWSAACTRPA